MITFKPLYGKLSAEKIKSCELASMILTAVLHVCQNYLKDLPLRTKSISLQQLVPSHTTHVLNLKKSKSNTVVHAQLPFLSSILLSTRGVHEGVKVSVFFSCNSE